MDSPESAISVFEMLKLLIQFLTPVTVLGLGWYLNQRLKKIDFNHWSNQKVIEKRLEIYDEIAPKLNMLLCFYTWIGDWKEISPDDVMRAKRELDKALNIYRHLFDDNVYSSYQSYAHLLFEHYVGAGMDAKFLTTIIGPGGDRSGHCSYDWNKEWNDSFSIKDVPQINDVRESYYDLMNNLKASIGLSKNGS